MCDFIKRFFFLVYIGGVTSQHEEIGQKVFSHRNFVQLLIHVRKKINLKRIFSYFEQAFLVTLLPLL